MVTPWMIPPIRRRVSVDLAAQTASNISGGVVGISTLIVGFGGALVNGGAGTFHLIVLGTGGDDTINVIFSDNEQEVHSRVITQQRGPLLQLRNNAGQVAGG